MFSKQFLVSLSFQQDQSLDLCHMEFFCHTGGGTIILSSGTSCATNCQAWDGLEGGKGKGK